MALKHECISYTSPSIGLELSIIKTLASNIKVVSLYKEFGESKKIKDTSYYGMNASWFNAGGTQAIVNIAYQDGTPQGAGKTIAYKGQDVTDGTVSMVGDGLVYYKGTTLSYADGVETDASSSVPKTSNSWAQGGIGLYLCDRDWLTKFRAQPKDGTDYSKGSSWRTALLVNTATKYVYLIASFTTYTTAGFRTAIMDYAGLTEGGSAGSWKAILLDGGTSTQMRGDGFNKATLLGREVCQILALRDKT